jgi:cytochrome c-type biogenesis protein CcmH/NrfG
MSFWRKEVIEFALDQETRKHMEEQVAWIQREPENAKPYFHLAQLYRVAFQQDTALGLLLEAVRLDPDFADAHGALAEIYITRSDDEAAWRHAHIAAERGDSSVLELLEKYKTT